MRDTPKLRLRREALDDLTPDDLQRMAAGEDITLLFCLTVVMTIELSCIPLCASRWCTTDVCTRE